MSKIVCMKIRSYRHDKNLTQKDVADHLGISIPAFSKIETGCTDANLSRIEQIANFFGISMYDLFKDDDELKMENAHLTALSDSQRKLLHYESEIKLLQSKIIELYEELLRKQG